jgi:hypothetical protein
MDLSYDRLGNERAEVRPEMSGCLDCEKLHITINVLLCYILLTTDILHLKHAFPIQ